MAIPIVRRTAAAAAFSADGQTLVAVSTNGTIDQWDVASRRLRLETDAFRKANGEAWDLAFSPDGKAVALASSDGSIKVWEIAAAKVLADVRTSDGPRHAEPINDARVALSNGGKTIAWASQSGTTVTLWDPAADRQLEKLRFSTAERVRSVALSPNGKLLALIPYGAEPFLWDVDRQRRVGRLPDAFRAAFSADRNLVTVSGSAGRIRFYAPDGKPRPTRFSVREGLPVHTLTLALDPGATTLAVVKSNGTIKLWDVASRAPLGEPVATVLATAFRDAKTLVSVAADGAVGVWDVARRQQLTAGLPRLDTAPRRGALSADGESFAFEASDGTLKLRNVDEPDASAISLNGPGAPLRALSFSRDAKTLAVVAGNGTLTLWDVAGQIPTRIDEPALRNLTTVAFSPDGKKLATATTDGTLKLSDRDGRTREQAAARGVRTLAFSPRGDVLALAANDGTIALWDVANWKPLGLPLQFASERTAAAVTSLAFSPDAKTLASASEDGTITLWTVDPDAWEHKLCATAGRALTQSEWNQYLPKERYHPACGG